MLEPILKGFYLKIKNLKGLHLKGFHFVGYIDVVFNEIEDMNLKNVIEQKMDMFRSNFLIVFYSLL